MNHDFKLIWERFPHRLKRFSTTWWFFLLFPRQEHGFGPKQMMFSLVGIRGDGHKVNHIPHSGMQVHDAAANFNGIAIGWIFDGKQLHNDLIHEEGRAVLSPEGSLSLWNEQKHGGEICAAGDKPYQTHVVFSSAQGHANFDVWGETIADATAPVVSADLNYGWGGTHVISWQRLRFAGEFSSPAGTEQLEGLGFFQRVCMDIPLMPWYWMWVAFEDESIFSLFLPFVGAHLFRRDNQFFPQVLESAILPLQQSATFYPHGASHHTAFEKVSIKPHLTAALPHFEVNCSSKNGDFFRFLAVSTLHKQILLDRPLGHWYSRYNYNEYLFRVEKLEGQIAGKTLHNPGNGFGNCEYTWGLALG